ncbi:hypothetical protein TNCV_2018251 [Trichonephila clavipes]|nr:hypothetical protein TNCV_2018251 [Trichonephila clavipes]
MSQNALRVPAEVKYEISSGLHIFHLRLLPKPRLLAKEEGDKAAKCLSRSARNGWRLEGGCTIPVGSSPSVTSEVRRGRILPGSYLFFSSTGSTFLWSSVDLAPCCDLPDRPLQLWQRAGKSCDQYVRCFHGDAAVVARMKTRWRHGSGSPRKGLPLDAQTSAPTVGYVLFHLNTQSPFQDSFSSSVLFIKNTQFFF